MGMNYWKQIKEAIWDNAKDDDHFARSIAAFVMIIFWFGAWFVGLIALTNYNGWLGLVGWLGALAWLLQLATKRDPQ